MSNGNWQGQPAELCGRLSESCWKGQRLLIRKTATRGSISCSGDRGRVQLCTWNSEFNQRWGVRALDLIPWAWIYSGHLHFLHVGVSLICNINQLQGDRHSWDSKFKPKEKCITQPNSKVCILLTFSCPSEPHQLTPQYTNNPPLASQCSPSLSENPS